MYTALCLLPFVCSLFRLRRPLLGLGSKKCIDLFHRPFELHKECLLQVNASCMPITVIRLPAAFVGPGVGRNSQAPLCWRPNPAPGGLC